MLATTISLCSLDHLLNFFVWVLTVFAAIFCSVLLAPEFCLGFASFACQDSHSLKALKRDFMEKGLKTVQDDKSIFDHYNFYIL